MRRYPGVELCEYLIRTYTRPSELVVDICACSGTTALYALKRLRPFMSPSVSASVRLAMKLSK